jgi:hypothetical protein
MATDAFVLISEPPQNTSKAVYTNSMSTISPDVLFICRLLNNVATNSQYTYKRRSDQRLDAGTRQKKRMRKEVVVVKFYGHVPSDIWNREPPHCKLEMTALSVSQCRCNGFILKFRHFTQRLTDNHWVFH